MLCSSLSATPMHLRLSALKANAIYLCPVCCTWIFPLVVTFPFACPLLQPSENCPAACRPSGCRSQQPCISRTSHPPRISKTGRRTPGENQNFASNQHQPTVNLTTISQIRSSNALGDQTTQRFVSVPILTLHHLFAPFHVVRELRSPPTIHKKAQLKQNKPEKQKNPMQAHVIHDSRFPRAPQELSARCNGDTKKRETTI